MSLRIKLALLFTAALLIGYFTGVYTTLHKTDLAVQKAQSVAKAAIEDANEVEKRLDSLCGPAILKFIPCNGDLEVCICGEANKYLKN